MGEEKVLKVCPRCGSTYSYIERRRINGKTYLYAVHYVEGKRRRCYLGADVYTYFNKVYGPVMDLLGFTDVNVVLEYLDDLTDYIRHNLDRFNDVAVLKRLRAKLIDVTTHLSVRITELETERSGGK